MSDTPWKSDEHFVSPWNFVPEVTKEFKFAPKIKIHDVTLRDGEQQTGVVFRKDDKIRIAEALAEAGVHRIEAGMPAVSPQDAEAITEIVKRDLGPEIFAFSRCMVEDVKRAVDTGVKGIVMEVPSSEHIVQYGYRWPLEKAIQTSIDSTRYAREQGLYVVFFPIDSSRAEMNWYLDLIVRVATEGHMDALAVVDTFGVTSPHAMSYLIRRTRERINKPLETHFHSDFGMGVANTIMALAEGAEVMHTTVLGLGERAGNAAMEEAVMALKTMYGIDLGINYRMLRPLAKLVEELSGQRVPQNKPIVGDLLFDVESGIIASWVKNVGDEHLTEVFPFRPETVGQGEPKVVFGKGSGIDSVGIFLEQSDETATEAQRQDILMRLKMASLERKGLLAQEELTAIVDQVLAGR
jgi:isopropylmalate/homocitrate/citramalate synthase